MAAPLRAPGLDWVSRTHGHPMGFLTFRSKSGGLFAWRSPLSGISARINAGLDFALEENTTAGVSYTGRFGDGVSDNGVKGRFTWLF